MKKIKTLIYISILLLFYQKSQAQSILMQGWYWDYPKTANGNTWADTLKNKAQELGQAGITHLWIPPHVKASFGSNSNGYDPKDLYDVGQHGATGLGTKTQFDAMISALDDNGIKPVGDMIYNHRDGGSPEYNPSVEGWIKNFNNPSNHPFPSDRARAILAIGGSTGRGAGDYYISIRSATGSTNFQGRPYRLYLETHRQGWQNMSDDNESEPNNGSGQFKEVILGRNYDANVDSGGGIDEYKLTLTSDDFNSAGDTLYIYFSNQNGDYSDHFIWNGNGDRNAGLWYDNGTSAFDVMSEVKYQTYTDFTDMPSGQGAMNHTNFKPNGNPTNLGGFPGDYGWDHMVFFYDYDQFAPDTKDKLFEWTKWNWETLGIRGLRMDAIKHFTPEFVGDLLDYMHDNGYDPDLVVGEWFGTNTGELSGWVNGVLNSMDNDTKEAIQPKIFDFLLRDNLRQACDGFGYDARNVYNNSLNASGVSGFNIVTFANNHDFRQETGFESLIHNDPILAYAYILTNNQIGLPTIFYPDYYGYDQDNFNYHPDNVSPMKNEINRLIQVHQQYIVNANGIDYLNRFGTPYNDENYIEGFPNTSLIYQISGGIGGKEVIVAINFAGESLKVDHKIKSIATGTKFTDVLGNSNFEFATVDNLNRIYMELPPRSFSVWVEGEAVPLAPSELTLTGVNENSASLRWTDNSPNETGFIIERKLDVSGTWEELTQVNSETTNYTDDTFETNQAYFYRIKANNVNGDSPYSNEVEASLVVASNEDDLAKLVGIYPNPSEGKFILSVPESWVKSALNITNAQGKSILSDKLQSSQNQIDISNNPSGTYFIKIALGNKVITKKIILK